MAENAKVSGESNERLRIWLNFLQVGIVSGAVALVTLLVNAQIQNKRLESEIKSNENAFISQFVANALDENLEKRRDFAEYFVRLAPTQESRERWIEYRDYAQALVQEAQRKEEVIAAGQLEFSQLAKGIKSAAIGGGAGTAKGGSNASGEVNDAAINNKLIELQAELAKQRRELAILRSETSIALAPVPDVIGLPLDRAHAIVSAAGLNVGPISGVESDKVPPESVVYTEPPPGTLLRMGEGVKFFVTPDAVN